MWNYGGQGRQYYGQPNQQGFQPGYGCQNQYQGGQITPIQPMQIQPMQIQPMPVQPVTIQPTWGNSGWSQQPSEQIQQSNGPSQEANYEKTTYFEKSEGNSIMRGTITEKKSLKSDGSVSLETRISAKKERDNQQWY